jgi:hypothetical protein
MTKEQLTTLGSTAALVAIGGVTVSTATPIVGMVLVIGGTALAAGSLYAKVTGHYMGTATDKTDK